MRKNILAIMSTFYVILFLTGCTADLVKPEINFEPPAYVEEMPAKEEKQDFTSTGSIFGQGDNPLFSDHKAMHVNDIVTVVISESSSSSLSGSKDLAKANSTGLGGLSLTSNGSNTAIDAHVAAVNGITNTGLATNTTNSFKGSGSATKDATFTTTVSSRIVKVLSNGNYFISGKREILLDEQKQIIQISGVIRPYDIDQYNKINSAQISDAKILYKTQGDVDRATEQGWGTVILEAIWPF